MADDMNAAAHSGQNADISANKSEERKPGGSPDAATPPVKPVEQRKELFSWSAPDRYFSQLNKKKYFMILACVIAFSFVLILIGQYYLMAAIWAVMFLVYVLGTVPPGESKHVITNKGVEMGGVVYEWEKLEDFWFSMRDERIILNVDTRISFPARLIMMVEKKDQKKLYEILEKKLIYLDKRKQGRIGQVMDGEWVDPATV